MNAAAFNHVSKIYHLGGRRTSLREDLSSGIARLLGRRNGTNRESFYALNDISFMVPPGDVLGIIGHNGAGKSTALKLLAGITPPDHGSVTAQGRIAAMIELGAGFHPELTGRQNIFLNASFMGLTNEETASALRDIITFSGLKRFIDTPVKRYSSGMYVRLAFAVAAHVNADLLLIDEVLSVGDIAFQSRCIDKMNELRDAGATIVLVTHSLWTVESFCSRAILLRNGMIEADGKPKDVVDTYRRYEKTDLLAQTEFGLEDFDPKQNQSEPVAIAGIELLDEHDQPLRVMEPGSVFSACIHYLAHEPVDDARFVIKIRRADGVTCCRVSNYDDTQLTPTTLHGAGAVKVCIGPLGILPDIYTVDAHIINRHKPILYASHVSAPFRVKGEIQEDAGMFYPSYHWQAAT